MDRYKEKDRRNKCRQTGLFYDTVIYTKWGPVTYDESYHAEDNLKGLCLSLGRARRVGGTHDTLQPE